MTYNTVTEVELPGWRDGEPFTARLRRPSLLSMAATGELPNELLAAAQKLFSEGYSESMPLDKLGAVLRSVAEAALVEPTLAELERAGCALTDVQLAAIYGFAQGGARALLPFRPTSADARSDGDV